MATRTRPPATAGGTTAATKTVRTPITPPKNACAKIPEQGITDMTYHYIRSGPSGPDVWIVGIGQPGIDWTPESEHPSPSMAIARVRHLNGGTVEMTPQLAQKGHCTLGGTIASGKALCQCGAWAAADYPDAETRKAARKEHLNLVGEIRRTHR
jgi:hypothetical protein